MRVAVSRIRQPSWRPPQVPSFSPQRALRLRLPSPWLSRLPRRPVPLPWPKPRPPPSWRRQSRPWRYRRPVGWLPSASRQPRHFDRKRRCTKKQRRLVSTNGFSCWFDWRLSARNITSRARPDRAHSSDVKLPTQESSEFRAVRFRISTQPGVYLPGSAFCLPFALPIGSKRQEVRPVSLFSGRRLEPRCRARCHYSGAMSVGKRHPLFPRFPNRASDPHAHQPRKAIPLAIMHYPILILRIFSCKNNHVAVRSLKTFATT